MTKRLEGKIAVVTAAGQGIGRAIAQLYHNEGAIVYASDIDASKFQDAPFKDVRSIDVTDTGAVEAYAAEVGAIDVLANVAGYVHHGAILDCDDAAWDRSFDINVKSMHRTIKAFLPAMIEHAKANGTSGSIINLSSAASSIKGAPNRYAYGTTKAAVIGLTKAVAIDFIKQNIRCNAICPGTVHSPSWEDRVGELGKSLGSYEEAHAQFVARQPMGRVGTADEIAALALYLAEDISAFTTGTAIPIDGGWAL